MLRRRIGRIVVREDPVRRSVHVVELTVGDAPPERRADRERERHGQRNQQEEDVHRWRESDSAPATTASDDSDMPSAATAGVTKPNAAAGIATAL